MIARSIFKAVIIEHFSTQFFCINMLLRARESLDLNFLLERDGESSLL